MSVRRTLRRLIEHKNGLLVPGAYDGVSARLVERAGFPAVYMTGYGTSASRLGLPDLGYAGLAEMADHARNLAAAVVDPADRRRRHRLRQRARRAPHRAGLRGGRAWRRSTSRTRWRPSGAATSAGTRSSRSPSSRARSARRSTPGAIRIC